MPLLVDPGRTGSGRHLRVIEIEILDRFEPSKERIKRMLLG